MKIGIQSKKCKEKGNLNAPCWVLQTKVKPVSKPIAAVGGKSGWETELNNIWMGKQTSIRACKT